MVFVGVVTTTMFCEFTIVTVFTVFVFKEQ